MGIIKGVHFVLKTIGEFYLQFWLLTLGILVQGVRAVKKKEIIF